MKRAVTLAVSILLVLCGLGVAAVTAFWGRTAVSTAGTVQFTHPLAIPPLAPSHVDGQGRRVFELTAQAGTHDFGGGPVPTLGYNGGYLGPTLRAERGEQLVVNVHNALPEPTTMHWHGMHLPAAMDGGPHQPIAPGATVSPSWRLDQPAATLWYHPHPHGQTAGQVYQGLAGLFIVDDKSGPTLPSRYGIDDVPVVVQDKRLTRHGQLNGGSALLGDVGVLGRTIAVNGTVSPYFEARSQRVRLRLLNGSNARSYNFGFADGRRFALVATDGGLLGQAYETDRIQLSPSERAEIVVTLLAGERALLRSFPPHMGIGALGDRFVGGSDTFDILEVRAAVELSPSPPVPATLADPPALKASDAVQHREFVLAGREINGLRMDMSRIDAVVDKGSVEEWDVSNHDGTPHSLHIHGVSFQVVSVGSEKPPAELSGWKDTVYLPPNVTYSLLIRFPDYADLDHPYMFHCHVLLHEDTGMMGQFVVVEPNGSASGHHHG